MRGPALGGVMPAVVTPFLAGDPAVVDGPALSRLVARAASRGVSGIVACGSTGEAPALSATEHARVVATAVEAAGGLPVFAGVGAPCTEAAAALGAAARQVGASGLLVSAPPYVKPSQAGLRAHVRAVAAAGGLPIILYDVPSRAGVAFADATIAGLAEDGTIAALKDATGDLSRPTRLARLCGPGFAQLSGEDGSALAHRAMGGAGLISVTANLVPALCAALHAAWDAGDADRAAAIRDVLAPLDAALFLETNPVPVKAALGMLNLCAPHPRLPLLRAEATTIAWLAEVLAPVLDAEEAEARLVRGTLRRAA